MRIRVIAPITSRSFVNSMTPLYAEKAHCDTEISVAYLEEGPASIESIYEDALAVPQVIRRAIEAEMDGADAVIIDCMNDPGLEAAREAVSIPVVGTAQASMGLAAILALKFSIIGTAARDVFPNELLVRRYGLSASYASTRWVNIPVLDLPENHDNLLAGLVAEAVKAIELDGAHAIIFGCTGMKGMAGHVQGRLKHMGLDTLVIDPSLAALKWAEMLVNLKLTHSRCTYPLAVSQFLTEHRQILPVSIEGYPGKLERQADIHVIVPVVRGFRDERWLAAIQRDYAGYARRGTSLSAYAIEAGPPTIESLYYRAMAVPEILRLTRKAEREGASAIVIDCMNDPGLYPAREAASIPVIGPAQASAIVGASLAHRFSILATTRDMEQKFIDLMEAYGISGKMASVRTLDLSVEEIETNPMSLIENMKDAAEKAITLDGAHLLIPGCTGMIGIAEKLQNALALRHLHVPVIEAPALAVKLAEALSDLGWSHSKITYPLPPRKALEGYSHLEF